MNIIDNATDAAVPPQTLPTPSFAFDGVERHAGFIGLPFAMLHSE